MKWSRLLSLLLPMVMLTSCAEGGSVSMDKKSIADSSKPAGGWKEISPKELSAMMDAKDFVMVNVHTPYEGELPLTDAFIPYDLVESKLSELPPPDGKLVVYCRTGRMSQIALETLSTAGYSNLFELKGGFEAWRSEDLPFLDNRNGR